MNRYHLFPSVCASLGIPRPVAEHRFAPPRRWRFDFAWPDYMIALEVEGGAWIQGRHTRGSGFVKDLEKYREAACLGWRVLRCTPSELFTERIARDVKRALGVIQ